MKYIYVPEAVIKDSRQLEIPTEMTKQIRKENYSKNSINVMKSDYTRNGKEFDENENGTNLRPIQWD